MVTVKDIFNIRNIFPNVNTILLNPTEFSKLFFGYRNTRWVNQLIEDGIILTVDPLANTSKIIPATELERVLKYMINNSNLPKKIQKKYELC